MWVCVQYICICICIYIYLCKMNLELFHNIPSCSNTFHIQLYCTDIPNDFPEVTQGAQAFWHLDQYGLIRMVHWLVDIHHSGDIPH